MLQTRSMTLFTRTLAVLVVTVVSVQTDAHVAPSVDDNNRYLKITPMRGGFRLAYTVFFGEIPGASERPLLDANRDGRIDEPEAKRFGDHLGAQVAASLELDVGAAREPVRWAVVDVGLGNAGVAAGAFSVDMIAYVCAPDATIRLRDQFRIPRPGETEVLVEDSPGTTVTFARIGAADDPRHDWRFLGPGGPMSDDGLEVKWTAATTAPSLPNQASCAKPPAAGGGHSRLPLLFGALIVGCAAAAGVIVGRRARRQKPPVHPT